MALFVYCSKFAIIIMKGGECMITNQKLTCSADGQIVLQNTVSCQNSLDEVRCVNECNPGGYFGDKNNEGRYLGTIPEEMFLYNPWLIMARKADAIGDKERYQHYLMKFFELFPAFMGQRKTRYWHGSRAVLL